MAEIQATRGKPRKGKQDDSAPTEVDEDELDPKLPFPMIHPTADWKIYWDLWISACIIWSTLTVPFVLDSGRPTPQNVSRACSSSILR